MLRAARHVDGAVLVPGAEGQAGAVDPYEDLAAEAHGGGQGSLNLFT
jgi:hypothetical protein